MPIPGSDFKYSFHADMELENTIQFTEVIKKIEKVTEGLVVLGVYKNGKVNSTN